VDSSTLKERGEGKVRGVLHPKCRSKRRKVSSLFSLHFFFSIVFLKNYFLLLEKKKMPSSFSFIFLFLFEAKNATTQACRCLFLFFVFVVNKVTTTSLPLSQNFPLLPPPYLLMWCYCSEESDSSLFYV
jgi:hypothetical protein